MNTCSSSAQRCELSRDTCDYRNFFDVIFASNSGNNNVKSNTYMGFALAPPTDHG